MVVTEQMNIHFREKEWRRNPKKIPKKWDSSKELLNLLKEIKENKKGVTIIPKIDELFDKEFLKDFDVQEMSFRNFYWTHFIKCPGNLRNRAFERRGLNLEICAEIFLTKEIRVLRPKAIVCMGKHASSWILKKTGYKHRWTEMLWEEIEWIIKNKKQVPEREIAGCNYKARIIVLPHPSGANPLATLLNQKLRNLLTFS
jgi:uracil-DNA glycosylase family 4